MGDNFPYADCDRWITGSWGNDAFRDEEDPEGELELVTCSDCGWTVLAEDCRELNGKPICKDCISEESV